MLGVKYDEKAAVTGGTGAPVGVKCLDKKQHI
jgi:hypothetical protein